MLLCLGLQKCERVSVICMWRKILVDIVIVLVLFVLFTNSHAGRNGTVSATQETITRTQQKMNAAVPYGVLLPPPTEALTPRAVAGIVFIGTMIMGSFGLDLSSSSAHPARNKLRIARARN